MDEVPASTKVRVSRIKNIETERLVRRQAYLDVMMDNPNEHFPRRRAFVEKAQEMYAIENALEERGHTFARRTIPNSHTPTIQHRRTQA